MKLGDRLREKTSPGAPNAETPAAPTASAPTAKPRTKSAAAPAAKTAPRRKSADTAGAPSPVDPFGALKHRAQDALFDRLGPRLNDTSLSETDLRALVMEELGAVIEEERAPLSPSERRRLVAEVADDVLGLGPLERFLHDDAVTEIMINGCEDIYVEREGRLHRTNQRFTSDEHLRRVIERIVAPLGRRIDESSPMVDARLPDGSRVNAIIPPLAIGGPVLTVRKFAREPYKVHDLVRMGTMSQGLAELLDACVRGRLNILVTGGTGTGKTTMLNVLSSFVPDDQRVITIEDAVELQLGQHHVIRLEARPANIEGRGNVSIRDLVRNALRMRPDRIIVGEVRGGEALDMLQAMNTGHEGSLSTVHANSPRDALARLETMVLMAGMDLPARAIREQVASALDLVVHITRMRDGTRRITHVTEVVGMEGDIVTLQDLFVFDYGAGIDRDGRFLGSAVSTGLRPMFSDRLEDQGIKLAPSAVGLKAVGGRGR